MEKLRRKWQACLALPGIFLLFKPLNAFAQRYHGSWLSHPGMTMGWGMGIFGMIFMIVFWGLIILGVVFLVKWLFGSGNRGANDQSTARALEILKERYARGEIDKDEFEARKQDLKA